jgi:parallel beta-helix repeat protein
MNMMKKGTMSILVCMVMIVSTMMPVSAATLSEKSSLKRGDTLYVGGSGPNNFTYIQDAINAASDYDTVFVYDDLSPYNESLSINRPISLIGEDKQSTVIEGGPMPNTPAMFITADGVIVQGFTIQTTPYRYDAIEVNSSKNIIKNNIVKHCWKGIELDGFFSKNLSTNSSVIEDNDVYEDTDGVFVYYSHFNTISHNRISSLLLGNSHGNLVTLNTITGGEKGIWIGRGSNNTILKNNIINNTIGIYVDESGYNSIVQNNIYRNTINAKVAAFTMNNVLMKLKSFNQTWDGNYWGRAYQSPKPIFGCSILAPPTWVLNVFVAILYKIIFKHLPFGYIAIGIPVIKFDQHPAQEPYDIPTEDERI